MKKKTKIIISVICVLFVIGVIQSIVNPEETTKTTDSNPTSISDTVSSESEKNNTEKTKSEENDKPTKNSSEIDTSATNTQPTSTEEQIKTDDKKPFTEQYDTEIVVTSEMILEQFISNYKIPLATQLWTIAKFDENGAVIAITSVTEKSTNISYDAIVVLTPNMDENEMLGGTPHYVSVGNTIYVNDGYCDEFLSNVEEFLNTQ